MDRDRFNPKNGKWTPWEAIHPDLLKRPERKFGYFPDIRIVRDSLTGLGYELWTILFITRSDDQISILATAALTQGDAQSYAVMLDLLEDEGVFTEDEMNEARHAARLWMEGYTGRKHDDQMRRLFGPPIKPIEKPPVVGAKPSPFAGATSTYIPNWGT